MKTYETPVKTCKEELKRKIVHPPAVGGYLAVEPSGWAQVGGYNFVF